MPQEHNDNEQDIRPNAFQDVIPPNRRSIRDIPIPRSRRKVASDIHVPEERPITIHKAPVKEIEHEEAILDTSERDTTEEEPMSARKPLNKYTKYVHLPDGHFSTVGKSRGPRIALLIGILLVVAGGFFFLTSSLSGAVIKVHPKQEAIKLENTYTAKKAPAEGELGFEVISLSKDGTEEVKASGDSKVSHKATGTIVVYNNFSKDKQVLVKNTRFQTPEGKIYRISEEISVPGQQIAAGKTVPGSLEVLVTADEAGESFNGPATDFTIPGFKGDPRFTQIYGRSKTPFTGGFVGVEKIVSAADQTAAEEKIKNGLKTEIIKELRGQIPANFIMYEDGAIITYQDMGKKDLGNGLVNLTVRVTANAVIFDRQKLADYIAFTKTSDADTTISGIENLEFALIDKESLNIAQASEVSFSLKGDAKIVWKVNQEKLASDLVGKSKNDLSAVLSNYPHVEQATAAISPVWKRSFPSEVAKIKIESIIEDN